MTQMNKEINAFIKRLQEYKTDEASCTNQYSLEDSEIQVENLRFYLHKMYELKPKKIIVGEAAGYKGCRLSGIPFTSEKTIKERAFFKDISNKYLLKEKLSGEISATIVWPVLENIEPLPLIWNIFPFHPHKKDNVKSNRTPTKDEIEIGGEILRDLASVFGINEFFAVGKKAEERLKLLGYRPKYIRHPANGGKNEFVEMCREFLK